MPDILVLGATGYTGRFTIKALDEHPQRDQFTYTIGVRSLAKGEALKKQLGLDPNVPLVEVDVLNADEVDDAVRSVTVVINLAGPYWLYGQNVQRSCALHGKRYVDLAGELHTQKRMIERFDYLATKTGAILIPACGFDSIPSDILVHLSNRTIKNALGPTAALGLSQTYFSVGGGFSGGSVASLMAELEQVPGHLAKEARSDWSLSPVRGLPCPTPSLATPVPFTSPQQYAGWWVIAAPNRGCVQRTWGLNELAVAATSSASVKERKVAAQYGPQFRYVEYFVTGTSKVTATAVSVGILVFFTLVTYCAPVRWLFKMLMPAPGSGPSEAHVKEGTWEITNVTECASSPGVYAKSTMRGTGNVGYYKTAYMLVESALALLLDDASLPEAARAGGVLTPSTALGGVLVSRLEAHAKIQFESQIIRTNPESKKNR